MGAILEGMGGGITKMECSLPLSGPSLWPKVTHLPNSAVKRTIPLEGKVNERE